MVPIFNIGIWKLEALSDSDLQLIRTQGTVSKDTSFIFVVFRWHGRVKARKVVCCQQLKQSMW